MRLSVIGAMRAGIAAVLLTAGVGVAMAQPASAAGPTHCIGTPKANGEGWGLMKPGTWNLKGGYFSECQNVGVVRGGEKVWFQCSKRNNYGNNWWYVRVAGTDKKGWISESNLAYLQYSDMPGGSSAYC
ncbi:hypothetical protein [Couchioplanes azureus]|uniref:hypothetical protein n=1 Tax=Couchioplanes caeruleus TaxID=56438 RepID=UPI001671850A|nr:hypothetical protein [Couchioplanes caeruleus]